MKHFETINFLYYIHNFNNIEKDLIQCFGSHLGVHFFSKVSSYMKKHNETYVSAANIINLMMNMDNDNKAMFLEYISINYKFNK